MSLEVRPHNVPRIGVRAAMLFGALGALVALGCQSAGRDPDCPVLPENPTSAEIAAFRAEAEAKKCVTPLDGDFPLGVGGGGGATGAAGAGGVFEGP